MVLFVTRANLVSHCLEVVSKWVSLYLSLGGYHTKTRQVNERHCISSTDYFSIGCWRDQPERALPSLEGIFPMLDGNDYMLRKYAIKKCSTIARVQGFPAFALENSGQCLGGKDILQTYNMYGASSACKADGRGGPWSMEVYKFTSE